MAPAEVVVRRKYQDGIRAFYQYGLLPATQPIVKVLVVCPMGTNRSVACVEILKYVIQATGKPVDKELRHISQHNWVRHRNSCDSCKYPYRQPRFKEMLDKAVQHLL